MKPIEQMTLAECLEEFVEQKQIHLYGFASTWRQELADRIHDLTTEWERRWKNLSTGEKIDALAHPPDSYSLGLIIKNQSKYIENLEKELSELKESTRWIPVSERMPTEDDAYMGEVFARHEYLGYVIRPCQSVSDHNCYTHWQRITPPETP